MSDVVRGSMVPCAAVLALTLAACEHSALPRARPTDFAVHFQESGGMYPSGRDVRCTNDGCDVARTSSEGVGPATHRAAAPSELDRLYAAFRDHAFDRIRTRKRSGVAHDIRSTKLTLVAASQTYAVEIDGTREVTGSDADNLRAVLQVVEESSR